MLTLTELLHGAFRQISAIINYIVVWKAEAKNHILHELNRCSCITLTDWLCLNPLCKFVSGHQKVGLFIFGLLKGPTMSSPQIANDQVIGIILNS